MIINEILSGKILIKMMNLLILIEYIINEDFIEIIEEIRQVMNDQIYQIYLLLQCQLMMIVH